MQKQENTPEASLTKIAEKQGTPIFLLDASRAEKSYAELKRAFAAFPRLQIHYSVKTNALPPLLSALAQQGSGFEVASKNELVAVLETKTAGQKIVFNGACKTLEELELALKQGALINVDSESELKKIAALQQGVKVGIRISFSESKFGFEAQKIVEAFEAAQACGLKPVALHAHPRSPCTFQEYKEYLEQYAQAVSKLKRAGFALEIVNLGSGFPDAATMKTERTSLAGYAEAIQEKLGKTIDFKKTTVAIEPGRFIASESMALLCRVCAIKQTFGRNWAIINAGINLVPSFAKAKLSWRNLTEENEQNKVKRDGKRQQYILGGPLLFSVDSLGALTGNLKEGDLLLAENAGAYCHALRWQMGYGETKVVEARW